MSTTTPEMDAVIEKVQKLLALGTSPNQAEAEAATAKAYALMARYNLTAEQVEGNTYVGRGYVKQLVTEAFPEPAWVRPIGWICCEFFHVKACLAIAHQVVEVWMVGTAPNAAAACQVYEYLREVYPRLWGEYVERHNAEQDRRRKLEDAFLGEFSSSFARSLWGGSSLFGAPKPAIALDDARVRASYYEGLTVGIAQMIDAERSKVEQELQEEGLVLVHKDPHLNGAADELFERHVPDAEVEAKPDPDKAAMVAGYHDGLKVSFAKAIASGEATPDMTCPDALPSGIAPGNPDTSDPETPAASSLT